MYESSLTVELRLATELFPPSLEPSLQVLRTHVHPVQQEIDVCDMCRACDASVCAARNVCDACLCEAIDAGDACGACAYRR